MLLYSCNLDILSLWLLSSVFNYMGIGSSGIISGINVQVCPVSEVSKIFWVLVVCVSLDNLSAVLGGVACEEA